MCRDGPCVDGSGLARRIFTLQQWSEQPCVRPVRAVPMTAGHNALSVDQVPVKSTHSMMLWPKWVVLIAGSDRFCIKCCSSSQPLRHAGAPAGSRSRRESGRLPIAFVPDHHGPGHPGEFVGKRYGSDLGGSPRQQSSEPGPMPGAVDFGIADHCKRASREEAAQIAIALLADIAKLVLTPARVLLRHEPRPRNPVPIGRLLAQQCWRPVLWPTPDRRQGSHPAACWSRLTDARP